jgi:hypothetical protein
VHLRCPACTPAARVSDETIVANIFINDEPGGSAITLLFDGTYLWVADNQSVMKLNV